MPFARDEFCGQLIAYLDVNLTKIKSATSVTIGGVLVLLGACLRFRAVCPVSLVKLRTT